MIQQQNIALDASSGDGSVGGIARLTAVQENNGYRVKGYVESTGGCVELPIVPHGQDWDSSIVTLTGKP
ncbi:hypothetical protein [Kitasatospora sp. NPDC059160]|uniref:hypothetical protein n=1 Tax=Kitasatospora sp. NPDC059160 TaxID=3346748 RepID=UPI0036AE7799